MNCGFELAMNSRWESPLIVLDNKCRNPS